MTTKLKGLSLKEKMKLYNQAISLRKKGLSNCKISKILNIKKATIDSWIYDGSIPDFCRVKFEPIKTPDLSYVIGVIFGDASLWKSKQGHFNLELKVKDADFACKFAKCLSKILKRKKSVNYSSYRHYYRVQVVSKALFKFIDKKEFGELKEFIEAYPTDFLQGFFDSEGNPHVEARNYFNVKVGAVSTDFNFLKYVQKLLQEKFGIKSGITIAVKTGSKATIGRREIVRNSNVYRLMIHGFENVKKFATFIGFTAERKQQKLMDAIRIKSTTTPRKAIEEWKKLYTKIGREWTKKLSSRA